MIVLSVLFLTSCWSYKGLDEITIVTGVAIDKDKKDNYLLTFEIIDLASSSKEMGITTEIIKVTGLTVSEAAKNAKTIVANELCFCDAQIIIIGKDLVSKEGITGVLDFFVRNIKVRETSKIVISKEKTAATILEGKGFTNDIIAFEMNDIIDKSEEVTMFSHDVQLYNAYNALNEEGVELVLPVFKTVKIKKDKTILLDGMATFKGNKLDNFLTPEETKNYLLIINKAKGGIVPLKSGNDSNNYDIGIEIQESNTKTSYSYQNNKIKMIIDINIKGTIGEVEGQHPVLDVKRLKELEKLTSRTLKKRISKFINKIQHEEYGDIFGFGKKIFQSNPRLWRKLKKEWINKFKELDFEVNCEVNIINSAFGR